MKTKPKFLKYKNLFQRYTNPGPTFSKSFNRALRKLHDRLGDDFINERDEIINETIVANVVEVDSIISPKHLPGIINIANYFECILVGCQYMAKDTWWVYNTVRVIGYEQDVSICQHVIKGYISGSNQMRANIQRSYRNQRLNERHRVGKNKDQVPSRVKASNFFYNTLDSINAVTKEILENRTFGDLHRVKRRIIEKKTMEYLKLDYKYPNAKSKRIEHAKSPGLLILNRIIN